MRKTKRVMLLAFVIMISVMSCNSEELFVEPVGEEIVNFEDEEEVVEEEDTETDSTLPCDFDLTTIEPNSTIIINCVLDLAGEIISVPTNVIIIYEGGYIINGTLNFSDNSVISGELLNSSLNLSGSTPQLKDPTFNFDPQRWDIVEGVVSDEVALHNRNILQDVIDLSKSMGVETFTIDKMDAYFHLEYIWNSAEGYSNKAIHFPSNFHLLLSDDVHFRLQANHWPKGYFIAIYERENVKITGGNFYGDRFTHDYSDILDEVGISRGTHEWPGLLVISGSTNIIIDGVYLTDSTGDAVILGAAGHRIDKSTYLIDPSTKFNKNVFVKNCTLTKSRRNNMSITDGEDLYIENCIISDAGLGDNMYGNNGEKIVSSAGINPKVGIDVEPYRNWNENDGFIWYEKVERVYIRGCTFTNNRVASIIDFAGIDVTVENCLSDGPFSSSFTTGGKYLNNTMKAKNGSVATAISLGSMAVTINGQPQQLSQNQVVSGNTIEGFNIGVSVKGENSVVSNNIVRDFWLGFKLGTIDNALFENNDLKSERFSYSEGIGFDEGLAKNITFNGLEVEVPRRPLTVWGINNNTDYKINFNNCSFKSEQGYPILIKDASNLTFTNTTLINTEFDVSNAPNFINN